MIDGNFDWAKYDTTAPDLSKEDVFSCDCEGTLAGWYYQLCELAEEIKEFIEARRFAEIDDDDWFMRASGKVAYLRISSRWVERQMLGLGYSPPYLPNDPRARTLRMNSEKIVALKRRVLELEKREGIA